jgi:3-oxoadipate enol-lactonase
LLDALAIDRCHIVGVSFGGMVAQEFVLRHPSRVDRLVLACTASGGLGGSSWDLQELQGLAGDDRLRAWLPKLDARNNVTTSPWTIAPGLAAFLAGHAARPPLSPEATAGQRRQLGARQGHDTWDRLPSIAVPTLCIGGRFDGQAPPQNLERLASRIPGAKLVFCEGGHIFFAQDPAAWPAVVAFLSAVA